MPLDPTDDSTDDPRNSMLPQDLTDEPRQPGLDHARLAHPEFVPDPACSRAAMESLQRELAETARFADDHALSPDGVSIGTAFDLRDGLPAPKVAAFSDGEIHDRVSADRDPGDEATDSTMASPIVVGVDQAFRLDAEPQQAISAAVAIRDGTIIEYAHAVTPLSIPYIPGLLAFREGGPMLAALEALTVDPDLLVVDGSGRIHYREAGLATHIGVLLDIPSVGVTKGLLCGDPDDPVGERPEGWRTPIRADDSIETMTAEAGGTSASGPVPTGSVPSNANDVEPSTIIGYAYQSRQYPNSRRINPLYVSPGHRLSAPTAVDLVAACCAGYKLPEPIRLADAYADVIAHGRIAAVPETVEEGDTDGL